jgi:hypothetical protein
MSKPCEYCGTDLPLGVDKRTRRIRSYHFSDCAKRPVKSVTLPVGPDAMADLLRRLEDAVEALDGTSVENEKLVDDYRAWRALVTQQPKDQS